MNSQRRRSPRDDEEAAAFKGMGQAITTIRERRGLERDELASKCEMTRGELEALEGGNIEEWWSGLRLLAKVLNIPLSALILEAEEFESGRGGEEWRQSAKEAEPHSAMRGARSDAAKEGDRRSGRRGR
jgi:transcriptional regulator with XRE-family HTH domain